MKARRSLQYAISMTWILSLLVGCGAPAATPTSIPPTRTPLPPLSTPEPAGEFVSGMSEVPEGKYLLVEWWRSGYSESLREPGCVEVCIDEPAYAILGEEGSLGYSEPVPTPIRGLRARVSESVPVVIGFFGTGTDLSGDGGSGAASGLDVIGSLPYTAYGEVVIHAVNAEGAIVAEIGGVTSRVEPGQSWMYREEHESDTGCYAITTYRLTNYGLLERNQIYVAGFRPASTAPFSCTHYQPMGSDGRVYDIEVAPDGDVWVATRHGAVKYNTTADSWATYTTEDGLADKAVRSITIEPDGSVWLATLDGEGVSHFDGVAWTQYTAEDGLISNYVHDVSVAPDGSVWFATREGASHWNRETDVWTHYTSENGLDSNLVWTIVFSSDGRVWFDQFSGAVTSLEPASLPGEEDIFESYSKFGMNPEGATISNGGSIWFGRALFDPDSQQLIDTVYWGDVQGLALDSKGGLWIVRQDGAVYIPDPMSSPEGDWQYLGASQGLADEDLTAIALETDKIVWLGAQAGVFRCIVEPGPE